MDDPKPVTKPSLREKIIASANWGMLAGFWIELPLLCAFFVKSHLRNAKAIVNWQKFNDWSLKLVLPSTLAGVIYGWNQPKREEAKLLQTIAQIDQQMDGKNDNVLVQPKSWVAAEQQRDNLATSEREK